MLVIVHSYLLSHKNGTVQHVINKTNLFFILLSLHFFLPLPIFLFFFSSLVLICAFVIVEHAFIIAFPFAGILPGYLVGYLGSYILVNFQCGFWKISNLTCIKRLLVSVVSTVVRSSYFPLTVASGWLSCTPRDPWLLPFALGIVVSV